MNTHNSINELWEQLRDAIDATYKQATPGAKDGNVLRDYARDISWEDNLLTLLYREKVNEKQHRSNRPTPKGFSSEDAAKLIIMNCVVRGSERKELPSSTDILVYRQTAIEAEVIGYLVRGHVAATWVERVSQFDYAKLMAA